MPALGAALPIDLSTALAIPAHDRTRSIRDVEHVVFLMQENRSFDHYFGTLRGVRGFAEPHPVTLLSGKSVFHQPDGDGELVTVAGDPHFQRRYAGHVETGEDTVTDPLMGGLL